MMKKKFFIEDVTASIRILKAEVALGGGVIADQVFLTTSLPPAESKKAHHEFIAIATLGDTVDYIQEVFKVVPSTSDIHLKETTDEDRKADKERASVSEGSEDLGEGVPFDLGVGKVQVIRSSGYPDQIILHTSLSPLQRGTDHLTLVTVCEESKGIDYVKENFKVVPELVVYDPRRDRATRRAN